MIMDGSKEQNLGDFARKLRDVGCHRKQIEPNSPWMNLCEGEIRGLLVPRLNADTSLRRCLQHPMFGTVPYPRQRKVTPHLPLTVCLDMKELHLK